MDLFHEDSNGTGTSVAHLEELPYSALGKPDGWSFSPSFCSKGTTALLLSENIDWIDRLNCQSCQTLVTPELAWFKVPRAPTIKSDMLY